MLKKEDLFKDIDEKYIPMLKLVNIPDFTKCIAQFAGIHINEVSDNSIKEYLLLWAKNKYKYFQLLDNKLVYDTPIEYHDRDSRSTEDALNELEIQYPAFSLWLEAFETVSDNKIRRQDFSYTMQGKLKRLFPHFQPEGSSLTYFFKKYLNAPDELVTAIGRVYENQTISATYTISIDPIDMMLASENPYNWTSCYRLEIDNDALHADGCLAAIIDDSSLITYIWNNEGKFNLEGNYDFKSVRYKRMRQWIAISPDMDAVHFNMIYPGKSNYPNDFCKKLRKVVENLINKDATWKKNNLYKLDCYREYGYGYSEYNGDRIYYIVSSNEPKAWSVFNQRIICPCGCGNYLPGSEPEDDEEIEYNGQGFIYENFDVYVNEYEDESHYCSYIDDYCDSENCEECAVWRRSNAVCELDENYSCENVYEAENEGVFDPELGRVVSCGNHCEGCPLYKQHHPEENTNNTLEHDNQIYLTTTSNGENMWINNLPTTLTINDVTWNGSVWVNNESSPEEGFRGGKVPEILVTATEQVDISTILENTRRYAMETPSNIPIKVDERIYAALARQREGLEYICSPETSNTWEVTYYGHPIIVQPAAAQPTEENPR